MLFRSTQSGVSFGHGAGVANADGPHFLWQTTPTAQRSGSLNERLAHFAAGDRIRMYAYGDGANLLMNSAEMAISLEQAD